MKTEIKTLNLSQDGNIQCFKWFNENSENYQGIVLICHGMAEHIERYTGFAEFLTNAGYLVYGYNQRGHKGSIASKEDYGYMSDDDNFKILVHDLLEISELIKADHPNLPLFIFGHSMGSFVTQRFIQLHGAKIDGVILSGSAKQPNLLINMGYIIARIICRFKGNRYRSKLLDRLSFGKYNNNFKPYRTEFDWLNRDELEVDKYINDEYCGGIFTAAYFKDFLKGLKNINHNYELVRKDLPMLLISGSKDPVGGPKKYVNNLYETYKKMEIVDLELKLYDDARHEILLELIKDDVMQDCLNWLNQKHHLNN